MVTKMHPLDVNIFIPELWNLEKNTRIKGYVSKSFDNILGLYIYGKYKENIHAKLPRDCCSEWAELNQDGVLDGDICKKNYLSNESTSSNYVLLEMENERVALKNLKLNGQVIDLTTMVRSSVVMFYDYTSILKSEAFFNNQPEQSTTINNESTNSNQFALLKSIIKHDNCICPEQNKINDSDSLNYVKKYKTFHVVSNIFEFFCSYSNLCVQFSSFTNSINWIWYCLWKEKKISVKTGNLLTSMLLDLLGGLVVLHCINQWTLNPVNELFDIIELIVDNLRALLKWLMGSPAGLKLNHAFNNMLGKFFLYHIELWWMFLVITKNIVEMVLQIFQFVGMLGISFQAAILADMLSLASFHIYCIYTYAARLYSIQISGLIALWRLFLGRKHNPLRGGVDSCQYDHHQLFIGTLAFTILLFLLPTTALYYVVFTTFRVILVMMGGFLTWLRYIIQSFPLYLVVLWLFKSKRIAGEIKISLIPSMEAQNKPTLLRVHLQTASILQLISKYRPPPFSKPVGVEWGEIISSLMRGKLLYPV